MGASRAPELRRHPPPMKAAKQLEKIYMSCRAPVDVFRFAIEKKTVTKATPLQSSPAGRLSSARQETSTGYHRNCTTVLPPQSKTSPTCFTG